MKESDMADPVVFAIHSHPDDIEFMLGGTLALLKQAGAETHLMNIANGSCGTQRDDPASIIARRTDEARAAAETLGAVFHPPLVDDLEVYYTSALVRRVCAVVREVQPTILLTASPQDYMEDHVNAGRLAVTAAFCRGMRNFFTEPPRDPIDKDVAVYHALPWGLRDPLRRKVRAGLYVNVTDVMPAKRAALACHASQKEWLDVSQGLDSYLTAMEDVAREVGHQSGRFEYAEGWRRRLHYGFCAADADPLAEILGDKAFVSEAYETELDWF
ncbi:MAG TPA: LmbE family protein [Candidatus Hydrogenedentes bacterium]|nr:LmbE family protein [Candidatus Hydrogenedentota bacterium]HIJ74839.1 LmbE family protein [Candidatus Hydrogenedentota bacterium]